MFWFGDSFIHYKENSIVSKNVIVMVELDRIDRNATDFCPPRQLVLNSLAKSVPHLLHSFDPTGCCMHIAPQPSAVIPSAVI